MYCYDNTALFIVTGPRDRHGEVKQICYEGDTHPNSILAAVPANSECNDFNICNHMYVLTGVQHGSGSLLRRLGTTTKSNRDKLVTEESY